MNKSDLKTGMLVELRNGNKVWVLKNTIDGDWLQWINNIRCLKLEEYNEDLTYNGKAYIEETYVDECKDYDIMKIYNPVSYRHLSEKYIDKTKLIYERKEYKEITKNRMFEILKEHFGCNVKIIE